MTISRALRADATLAHTSAPPNVFGQLPLPCECEKRERLRKVEEPAQQLRAPPDSVPEPKVEDCPTPVRGRHRKRCHVYKRRRP
jgi:hypothetical protein